MGFHTIYPVLFVQCLEICNAISVCISLPCGFYFFEKPNPRALCCVNSPGHREQESRGQSR